jgi:NADPH:quinone reductase-like Zn-dependent oxidoreductase
MYSSTKCTVFVSNINFSSSDGAGEVIAVGDKVTRCAVGQRVVATHFQSFIAGPITADDNMTSLGGSIDGALREYAVFNEQGLVLIPSSLSYREAATLPCAALTAWNCLYAANVKPLKPGDTVLVQGTGGVSIFALQFARAGGAEVIATTSETAKEELLRRLGARHVINDKTNADWGEGAKNMSTSGRGADYVVEIGGPTTMAQSYAASAVDGVIAVVGTRDGRVSEGAASHTTLATIRRIMVGSRLQLEDMIRAVSVGGIKPAIDSRVFKFSEVREAYQYLNDQNHVGKVVIDII